MKRLLCFVCVLVISSFLSYAHSEKDGAEIADDSWSKQKDRFGAMLFLSDKPDEFLEAWDQTTKGVSIHTTDTISRGVPIVAFVIFVGCKPDDEGLCNATVDFTVLKPDGTEYASFKDKDLWKNKPAMEEDALQLSADYIGVIIEPDDPLGRYEVRVLVRDHNADVSLELKREFTATESGS